MGNDGDVAEGAARLLVGEDRAERARLPVHPSEHARELRLDDEQPLVRLAGIDLDRFIAHNAAALLDRLLLLPRVAHVIDHALPTREPCPDPTLEPGRIHPSTFAGQARG